jgi:hypothetical protein
MKLKLDLHDIYNRGDEIERALHSIIDEAVTRRAPLAEIIIPSKGHERGRRYLAAVRPGFAVRANGA